MLILGITLYLCFHRWRLNKEYWRQYSVAAGTVALIVYALLSYQQTGHENHPELVEITLVHPKAPSVNVTVPSDYLGPRFLELSKKNLQGGEQKRFLIEFYYPSMLPSVQENVHLMGKEALVHVSVSIGVAGGIRRFAETKVSGGVGTYFKNNTNTLCGASEYEQRIKNGTIRTGQTLYYYRQGNPEDDAVFLCSNSMSSSSLCALSIENLVSSQPDTSFYFDVSGYPYEHMCKWKSFSKKMRKLVGAFQHGSE